MTDYLINPDRMAAGFCECGCGDPAPIATRTSLRQGVRRGEQLRFVSGHNSRRSPDLSRFVVTMTGCHEWTGPRTRKGYGRIQTNRIHRPVHVVVWEQANGPLPAGMHVDHQCHNHPCMFIDHLRLLTPLQNNRAKRVMKMTEEQAELVRASVGSSREVAMRFGISPQYVRDIRCGRRFAAALRGVS